MNTFQLHPVSKKNGKFAPEWFDNEPCLWEDERLQKSASLLNSWTAPSLQLVHPQANATKVLFNPNALAVSESVKEQLYVIPGIEFLPVHIKGHTQFFLLHVTACVSLPEGSGHRRATPSGNIVEVFSFPKNYVPIHPIFRVLQPRDSAAGKVGFCTRAIYLNQQGAKQFESAANGLLKVQRLPDG